MMIKFGAVIKDYGLSWTPRFHLSMATIIFDNDSPHFNYGSKASTNNNIYYGGSATLVTSDTSDANGLIMSAFFSGM